VTRFGHWRLLSALAGLLLFVGLACLNKPSELPICGNNADCEEGQACTRDNVCVDASCLSSADCGIDQFCGFGFMCRDGCAEDGDCIAGETCNEAVHECEGYGCRDTHLDCDLGEYCDSSTGECYLSDEGHCASCDREDFQSCGLDGSCTAHDDGTECWGDGDCPGGQTCEGGELSEGIPGNCSLYLCEISCDPEEDEPCPRGFSCVPSPDSGNICFGDCMWMYESGYTE
jgi:hypothetical protein